MRNETYTCLRRKLSEVSQARVRSHEPQLNPIFSVRPSLLCLLSGAGRYFYHLHFDFGSIDLEDQVMIERAAV